MELKRQRIVLDIVYSAPQGVSEPALWDWAEMLDLGALDSCNVVARTGVDDAGKTPYFNQKDAPLLLGCVGVLQRKSDEESDYVLHGSSCWIEPSKSKGVVYIVNSDDGIIVSVYRSGDEMGDEVATMQVFHGDLELDEDNDNG